MGWSAPSTNDYLLAGAVGIKLKEPDDSAAVGSFWQGAKPREDSGVWESSGSSYAGRTSDGGVARTTKWKKVAEPAWKKSQNAAASAPAGGSMAASPPASTNPAAPELEKSATEARERAAIATQTMRATIPQVEKYDASNPNAGTQGAINFGISAAKDYIPRFIDSLYADAGEDTALNKKTMLGAIRALPTNLKLTQPVNIAKLYDQYSKNLG